MQEWLEGWLRHNGIEYAPNDNTQMPPDVFLDPQDKKHNLMEVKAFNYNASPSFDIADFRMYEREIKEKPWMLDVDYLVFGYDMSNELLSDKPKQSWQNFKYTLTCSVL